MESEWKSLFAVSPSRLLVISRRSLEIFTKSLDYRCAHSAHLHNISSPFRVFLSLPRIYIEPIRPAESFLFASWIFSFRCFPSSASAAFLTCDSIFDISTSLIDQSSDNSLDSTQLSQHREVSSFVVEQSGEQRRDEAASDLSRRFRLALGPRIRAEFQISLPPNRALGQGMDLRQTNSVFSLTEKDDHQTLKIR
jgi:hypothetical protein